MTTVGEAVRARREELGLSQDRIAAVADVSGTTWRKLENDDGSTRRAAVERRIETALGWPQGTIARIEEGGEPPAGETPARVLDRLDAIEATLAQLAEAVSHLTTPVPAAKRGRGLRR